MDPPRRDCRATAKLMAFHNLGLLPGATPMQGHRCHHDRDIALRVVGKDRLAAKTKVGDVMTAPVQFVRRLPGGSSGEMMVSAGYPACWCRRRGTSQGPCQPRRSAGS